MTNPDIESVLKGESGHCFAQGDCLALVRSMPDDSVDLIFTSPPYSDARLYREGGEETGIARKPDEWVAWMLEVCEEARRVCKGLCAFVVEGRTKDYRYDCTPFLLLADLHRRGFNLRKPCVFRRCGIPGSGGTDWLRNDWEPVVCFSRPGKLPWSDNKACGHKPKYAPGGEMSNYTSDGTRKNKWGGGAPSIGRAADGGPMPPRPGCYDYSVPAIANPGNVIDCNAGGGVMGNRLCHENEAAFPEALAEFFVLSFCPPGGVVLDIFSGSGTTAAVAVRNGRRAVGIDLRASQIELGGAADGVRDAGHVRRGRDEGGVGG